MGTTEDKLRYLWKSKQDIINALKVKGVEVDPSVPFDEYGAKIKTIEGGGDVILCQNMQALNDLVPVAEGALAIVYDANTDHFSGLYEGKADGNWNLVFTTEDGTATENDICGDKIAYVKGKKITGNLNEITRNENYNGTTYLFINSQPDYNRDELVARVNSSLSNKEPLFRAGSRIIIDMPYNSLISKYSITADKLKKGFSLWGVQGTLTSADYSDTLTPTEYTTALATANEILTGMASNM